MSQQETVEFLLHETGRLASQQGSRAEHVGLDLVIGDLDFPSFVVERGEFGRWLDLGVEQRGDEREDVIITPGQPVAQHPHRALAAAAPTVAAAAVEDARPGSVGETLVHRGSVRWKTGRTFRFTVLRSIARPALAAPQPFACRLVATDA